MTTTGIGRPGSAMTSFRDDFHQAWRSFVSARRYGFAVVAVLGLGIAVNAAMFSVLNALLLEPLPFVDPDALVAIWSSDKDDGRPIRPLSYLDYLDWRDAAAFEAMAVHLGMNANVALDAESDRVAGLRASASLFPLLGVDALLGRVFTASDDRVGAADVVVLSHGLWREKFGGSAAALGRELRLDGRPYTVIGVMPDGFEYPGVQHLGNVTLSARARYWVPVAPFAVPQARGTRPFSAVGRLAAGVSLEAARDQLAALALALEAAYPTTNQGYSTAVLPLHEATVGNVRPRLLGLLAAVAAVLLISCVNVANLALSRAADRADEFRVRAALGAPRGRVARQLVLETVLLAGMSGVLGATLANAAVRLLPSWAPADLPRITEVGMDYRVLGFTAAIALLAGLASSLLPALHVTRDQARAGILQRQRDGTSSSRRMGALLGAVEIALAVILVVGAGTLLRGLAMQLSEDVGFDADGVLTAEVSLPLRDYPSDEEVARFVDDVVGALARAPGIDSAAASAGLPMMPRGSQPAQFSGRARDAAADEERIWLTSVTPELFDTLNLEVVRGRAFRRNDDARSRPVVMVSETLARTYWPGADPIGETVTVGSWRGYIRGGTDLFVTEREVVGVVADIKNLGPAQGAAAALAYFPHRQDPWPIVTFSARTTGPPLDLVPTMRRIVREQDSGVPLSNVQTMRRAATADAREQEFQSALLTAFAGLALGLAALGVYAVMARDVARRRRETGVRMAVGASPQQVLRHFMRRAAVSIGVGLAVGLLGAVAIIRLTATRVAGLGGGDAGVYLVATAVITAVAAAACFMPARDAARASVLDNLNAHDGVR